MLQSENERVLEGNSYNMRDKKDGYLSSGETQRKLLSTINQ